MGKMWKEWQILFSWAPEWLGMVTALKTLKDAFSLEEMYDKPRQCIKKQRHHFADKGPCNQRYGFSSSHICMWELEHKRGWMLKNWCFQTMVLEKTLESPLDCKEIKSVNPKGNQSWIFIGRTDAEAEVSILWPPDAKSWLIGKDPDAGKDWRQEEKRWWQKMRWLDSIINSKDIYLSKFQEIVEDRRAWCAKVNGVAKCWTLLSDLTAMAMCSTFPLDAGKDWRQEEREAVEDEMNGWHHWLNGHEFEQTPGDSEG